MTSMNPDLFVEAYRCRLCGTMIHHRDHNNLDSNTAKGQFWPHLHEHHPEALSGQKRTTIRNQFEMCCATCEKPFASKKEIFAHVTIAHPKHRVNENRPFFEGGLNHKIVLTGTYGQPRLTIRLWMIMVTIIVGFIGLTILPAVFD